MTDTDNPRVAVLSMQKDEAKTLPTWLAYYARLVGAENIHLIDNGSEAPGMAEHLAAASASGVNVLSKPGRDAFVQKGEVVQELARSLAGRYDVVIPVDGDEFLTMYARPAALIDHAEFYREMAEFLASGRPAGYISAHFVNIARSRFVVEKPFKKVFIQPDSAFRLNRGFHFQNRHADVGHRSGLAYIHFHHKETVEDMQTIAVPKLGEERLQMIRDSEPGEKITGQGSHMAKFLAMSQSGYERYMDRIPGERIDVSPVFEAIARPVPFT